MWSRKWLQRVYMVITLCYMGTYCLLGKNCREECSGTSCCRNWRMSGESSGCQDEAYQRRSQIYAKELSLWICLRRGESSRRFFHRAAEVTWQAVSKRLEDSIANRCCPTISFWIQRGKECRHIAVAGLSREDTSCLNHGSPSSSGNTNPGMYRPYWRHALQRPSHIFDQACFIDCWKEMLGQNWWRRHTERTPTPSRANDGDWRQQNPQRKLTHVQTPRLVDSTPSMYPPHAPKPGRTISEAHVQELRNQSQTPNSVILSEDGPQATSGLVNISVTPQATSAQLSQNPEPLTGMTDQVEAPTQHKEPKMPAITHKDCLRALCAIMLLTWIMEQCIRRMYHPHIQVKWFTTRIHKGIYKPKKQQVDQQQCVGDWSGQAQPILAPSAVAPFANATDHTWCCRAQSSCANSPPCPPSKPNILRLIEQLREHRDETVSGLFKRWDFKHMWTQLQGTRHRAMWSTLHTPGAILFVHRHVGGFLGNAPYRSATNKMPWLASIKCAIDFKPSTEMAQECHTHRVVPLCPGLSIAGTRDMTVVPPANPPQPATMIPLTRYAEAGREGASGPRDQDHNGCQRDGLAGQPATTSQRAKSSARECTATSTSVVKRHPAASSAPEVSCTSLKPYRLIIRLFIIMLSMPHWQGRTSAMQGHSSNSSSVQICPDWVALCPKANPHPKQVSPRGIAFAPMPQPGTPLGGERPARSSRRHDHTEQVGGTRLPQTTVEGTMSRIAADHLSCLEEAQQDMLQDSWAKRSWADDRNT